MNDDNFKEISSSSENNNINSIVYQKYALDEIVYTIILTGAENNGEYSLIEMMFLAKKEKRCLRTNTLKKI